MSKRITEYPVHDIIVNRWSSRAMSGEAVPHEKLMSLFEAARWAPSSFNNQPWRFVYTTKDSPQWENFFNLLDPFNQSWIKNAGVLIVVLSLKTFDKNGEMPNELKGQPSRTHSYDTGAACENLMIQGVHDGLVMHQLEGFDYDKAREVVKAPAGYAIECMISVGMPGDVKELPDYLQERETMSGRKPLKELVSEGAFEVK